MTEESRENEMAAVDGGSETKVDLEGVKKSTSILVLAPEMEETVTQICHDLLRPTQPAEAAIVKISYHFSPGEIAERWVERNPDSRAKLYSVSVTDSGIADPDEYGENMTFENARAEDLTGLGMKINGIIGELDADQEEIYVCLDSLDSMLMYTDRKTVYRFIRTISNFLAANGAQIHFHLDPTQHDEIVNTLRSAVNAIVSEEDGTFSVKRR